MYVVGHGLTEDDIQGQYDIGSVFFDHISDKEKGEYVAKIVEEGSWAGCKAGILHVDVSPTGLTLLISHKDTTIDRMEHRMWTRYTVALPSGSFSILCGLRLELGTLTVRRWMILPRMQREHH